MNITNYRGIQIIDTSVDFEYEGKYLNEVIKGYAATIEKVKDIIDETIDFIEGYQEDDIIDDYYKSNSHKKSTISNSEDY